jgi:L-ascorbate metabolism protein UlaG (beta-lactamase superfamily)
MTTNSPQLSTQVTVENPANAFVIVRHEDKKIILDPWIRPGIYDGGWEIVPPLKSPENLLADVTHLYITHLHEDHCDQAALAVICRKTKVFLPKVFASHVLERKLKNLGFVDLQFLDPGSVTEIASGIFFEVIGPMNAHGQEFELYSDSAKDSQLSIDTGLIISTRNQKLVFLADNTPYKPSAIAASTLNNMRGCDLLAFPYNGSASDYPICYTNIDDDAMLAISDQREEKRAKAIGKFISEIQPRNLMPYSSDFAVRGPAALRFGKFADSWWIDKSKVAERYSAQFSIPAFSLYENDFIVFDVGAQASLTKKSDFKLDLRKVSNALYKRESQIDSIYKESGADLMALTSDAADHVFDLMKRFGIRSEWILRVNVVDKKLSFNIDLEGGRLVENSPPARKVLSVFLNAGYYEALLTGKAHWNNAQLSFQLRWERIPNEYCQSLYKSLNFFHIKQKIS